ncbi:tyrosine-type recombinase/integrase [Acidithiobacillus ferriphilus]|uniref:tyrosine-type recombinase/integrase n=1 Tax=Acidithiobacillus ferriphilus TaxID=1689834 RepID=UPI0027E08AC9|nr:tyrosine-type recombinase/integrase [Acidithiobacillus ferriphilus]
MKLADPKVALLCRLRFGSILPIRDIWKDTLAKLQIKDLRWHDLRHEAASRLFEKGLHPMEVVSITGHKNMQMLKRYTHLKPESLLEKLG